MESRRNEYDVTNQVNTTDVASVSREVNRIFQMLYPDASPQSLNQSFDDVRRVFRGDYPGYRACDTDYHNLQHTLDVALAMARIMDGYERSREQSEPIGARLFVLGTVTALLHDVGYIRRTHDTRHHNGAEYTLTHVSRGARFIEEYMSVIGMTDLSPVARQIVHFTGFERAVNKIKLPGMIFRMLGNMLGTADIIAQMSDRCYLEKCHDRLFPEFVAGGLAESNKQCAANSTQFSSPGDLVSRTPMFYRTATARLNDVLGGAYTHAQDHFGGQNLYLDEIDKNISYAESVAESNDMTRLRRTPPSANSSNYDVKTD